MGVLDSLQEPSFLFLLRNMEKEFPHNDAVPPQILFEIADVFETLRPDFFAYQFRRQFLLSQKFGMHANNEHLFIVTTVEDSDVPAIGQAFHTTPEVIMIQVLNRRRLE